MSDVTETVPAEEAPASEGEATAEDSTKELHARHAKEQEQGYRGVAVDPIPNDAYSLRSGPDGPESGLDSHTRSHQPVLPKEVQA